MLGIYGQTHTSRTLAAATQLLLAPALHSEDSRRPLEQQLAALRERLKGGGSGEGEEGQRGGAGEASPVPPPPLSLPDMAGLRVARALLAFHLSIELLEMGRPDWLRSGSVPIAELRQLQPGHPRTHALAGELQVGNLLLRTHGKLAVQDRSLLAVARARPTS